MRLRKHASKLLGWAYSSQFHSPTFPEAQHCWPPPPPAEAEDDAGELHCQLNQSPWDAIESPHCTNSEEEFAKSNEEEDVEMDGVAQSGYKAKEDEEKDNESLEEIVKDAKENNDEKRPSGSPRESTEAEMEIPGMKCKKTDGKGWHCKRAAQIPHSLCSYHLTQVRSYRNRFEEQIYGNGSRGNRKRRLKPAAAGETGGVASNYYYYSVIGPWWGKRRGPIEVRESSESDISPQEHDENTDNGGVADEEEDDDDGKRRERVSYEKKRPFKKKKRGRKPVKARSLKSLL